MPYWAVAVVVVVLVVVYYLLSQQGRERRTEKIGVGFAKIPNFYANQIFTDVRGEAAMGFDDRGRRIAVARKKAQPRTRVYSFSHLLSAEVLQGDQLIASLRPGGEPGRSVGPCTVARDASAPADSDGEAKTGSLYGSTNRSVRDVFAGQPVVRPAPGQVTSVAVRVRLRNGEETDEVVIRFYQGKPVNVDGVEGERALAEAQVLLGSLDIAIKRAGVPPKGPTIPKTPVL